MQQQEARAFWTGPRLSPYEELSLKSFVAAGARVFLYSPEMTLEVPDGVELRHVDEILARPIHKFTYEDGDNTLTVHSDLFRYQAIHDHGGWYFDLDIICLGNALPRDEHYIAREDERLVNAAVMKFPPRAPFLAAAIDESARLLPKAGRLDIGPELVTRLAKEHLGNSVKPRPQAYEVRTREVLSLFDPARRAELEARTARSDFVHLWNEIWRRIRIPKNYGPPKGSFLDALFERHGIGFSDEARFSFEAVENWMEDRGLLDSIRERRPARASVWKGNAQNRLTKSKSPQIVRSLWIGDLLPSGVQQIDTYQLLCLKTFADRDHRVELYVHGENLELPGWIVRRDIGEIIETDSVVRYLPEQETYAVNSNLFRYSALYEHGGWWIDPGVVLLEADMPANDFVLAERRSDSGIPLASVLKFPRHHPLMAEARDRCAAFERDIGRWHEDPLADMQASVQTNTPKRYADPVGTSGVEALFDPAQCRDLMEFCGQMPFIDLHREIWLRAGIPHDLAPPEGSFVEWLLGRHNLDSRLIVNMHFPEVQRWLRHLYMADRVRHRETK